jgi:hypothetical protein
MAVNPNIALSVRGLELPDPLAQYGKVQAIQQAQQQNALVQMQMQQAQREVEQRNALNRAYSEAYTPEGLNFNRLTSSLAAGGFGSQIPAAQKSYFEGQEARTKQQKAESDLLTSKLQQSRSLLDTLDPNSPDSAAQYIAWHEANHADPVIGPALAARGVTVDTARAEINKAIQTPGGLQNLITRSAMGLEKFMEFNKPSIRTMDVSGEVLTFEDRPGQPPRLIESRAKTPLSDEVAAQRRLINMPPSERAEQQARGTMLVKEYEQVRDQANSARQTIPALQSNLGALDRGFETGAFTGVKAEAANVLSALGVKDAEKFATNAQTFLANAQQQVLNNQLLQKGPQTDSDAKRISQTGAQLGNTRQANRFILKVAEAQAKRSIEQQKFYAGWYRQNNTYDGAEDAWIEGEGGKSLFERPELNEYVDVLGPVMGQPEQDPRLRRLDDIFSR